VGYIGVGGAGELYSRGGQVSYTGGGLYRRGALREGGTGELYWRGVRQW